MKITPDISMYRTGAKITISLGVTLRRRVNFAAETDIRKGITLRLRFAPRRRVNLTKVEFDVEASCKALRDSTAAYHAGDLDRAIALLEESKRLFGESKRYGFVV